MIVPGSRCTVVIPRRDSRTVPASALPATRRFVAYIRVISPLFRGVAEVTPERTASLGHQQSMQLVEQRAHVGHRLHELDDEGVCLIALLQDPAGLGQQP